MGKPVITAPTMQEAITFLSEVHTATLSCFLESFSYLLIFREGWPKSLTRVFGGMEYNTLYCNYNGNNYNKQHGTHPRGWLQYTSRADTFWWRFEWKFFQSSFAVAILAWMPLAFSLVNRVLKSSPLESMMFSLCCPFSLSDKNSYKEKGKRLGIIKCFIH